MYIYITMCIYIYDALVQKWMGQTVKPPSSWACPKIWGTAIHWQKLKIWRSLNWWFWGIPIWYYMSDMIYVGYECLYVYLISYTTMNVDIHNYKRGEMPGNVSNKCGRATGFEQHLRISHFTDGSSKLGQSGGKMSKMKYQRNVKISPEFTTTTKKQFICIHHFFSWMLPTKPNYQNISLDSIVTMLPNNYLNFTSLDFTHWVL